MDVIVNYKRIIEDAKTKDEYEFIQEYQLNPEYITLFGSNNAMYLFQ